jgi:hypothetical protein
MATSTERTDAGNTRRSTAGAATIAAVLPTDSAPRYRPRFVGTLQTPAGLLSMFEADLQQNAGTKTVAFTCGLAGLFQPEEHWTKLPTGTRVAAVWRESAGSQLVALVRNAADNASSLVHVLRISNQEAPTTVSEWNLPTRTEVCVFGRFGPSGATALLMGNPWTDGEHAWNDREQKKHGEVWRLTLGDPQPLLIARGTETGEGLGYSLLRLDDLDGDRTDEVLIGRRDTTPRDYDRGSLAAWSPATDKELWRRSGELEWSGIHERPASVVGDVDKDGKRDLLCVNSGRALIVSGLTGTELRTFTVEPVLADGPSCIVDHVVATRDRDGDGIEEFAITYTRFVRGDPTPAEPCVVVQSGATGKVLFRAERTGECKWVTKPAR